MQLFNESFIYTLEPPGLGRHSVDEFLWETRRGFCEHFASSFAVFMRAAGYPARVVGGYQGGEVNPIGRRMTVRQSDAHAWSEVWLAGEGWVRVDPTAAVDAGNYLLVGNGVDDAFNSEDDVTVEVAPARFTTTMPRGSLRHWSRWTPRSRCCDIIREPERWR